MLQRSQATLVRIRSPFPRLLSLSAVNSLPVLRPPANFLPRFSHVKMASTQSQQGNGPAKAPRVAQAPWQVPVPVKPEPRLAVYNSLTRNKASAPPAVYKRPPPLIQLCTNRTSL